MGYGLLAGFGRGLSQGASMVQQGMAEDRAVKREDEREKMRQASIERRWKVEDKRYNDQVKRQDEQDQKADSRYKDEVKWRKEQSDKQDRQFNAQMRSREAERIEQNIAGLMSAQERHEQKIQDKYREQILSGNGDPKALQAQLENEIAQTRAYYDSKLGDMVKGYGNNLKGTSFEHLLYSDGPKQGEPTNKFLQDAGVVDANGNFIDEPAKGNGRKGFINDLRNGGSGSKNTKPASEPQGFGFMNGIRAGYNSTEWGNTLQAENEKFDPYYTTPVGHALHPIGGAIGLLGGYAKQGYIGAKALAGATFHDLAESPAERDARLSSSNSQQYAQRR